MTGTEMERDDDRLEHFFAAARRAAPAPSEELLARILADAEQAMPARPASRGAAPHGPVPGPVRGAFLRWLAAPAGWGAVGGLATAAAAGLWVGYAGPGETGSLAASLIGAGTAAGATELLRGGDSVLLLAGWEG